MSNKLTVFFCTIMLVWLSACHRPKIAKTPSKNPVENAGEANNSVDTSSAITESAAPLKLEEINFNYLTTKSKFSFKNHKEDMDNVTVNMRIRKDSLIWLSVTGVGLEVARGLITQDSILFADKIHKEFFKLSYEQLSQQYQFKITYNLLQSVIIGNLPYPIDEKTAVDQVSSYFILRQLIGNFVAENYISKSNFKLSRLNAVEKDTDNHFSLAYSDFNEVNTSLFPFNCKVKLTVKSPKDQEVHTTSIEIKHIRAEMQDNNPGFPFSIPSSYKRKSK